MSVCFRSLQLSDLGTPASLRKDKSAKRNLRKTAKKEKKGSNCLAVSGYMEYIVQGSKNKMIVIFNLLWSAFVETKSDVSICFYRSDHT